MSDTKIKFPNWPKIKIVTPAGVARFPKVHEPDEFKGVRKFKTGIVFDGGIDTAGITEAALKVAAAAFPTRKADKVNILLKDGDEAEKDGAPIPELQGKVFLNATCSEKYAPLIVGPDRKPLPEGMSVRGGDLVKLIIQPTPSETPVKGTITFRLLGVQLVEKRAGGGGADADMFDIEGEGFDAPKADAEPSSGVDAGAGALDSELPF